MGNESSDQEDAAKGVYMKASSKMEGSPVKRRRGVVVQASDWLRSEYSLIKVMRFLFKLLESVKAL
jgi:hypothetical protein